MAKVRVVLTKPVYAGMAILELSKRWIYGFHYDMMERYGLDRIRVAYMDIINTICTRGPILKRVMVSQSTHLLANFSIAETHHVSYELAMSYLSNQKSKCKH